MVVVVHWLPSLNYLCSFELEFDVKNGRGNSSKTPTRVEAFEKAVSEWMDHEWVFLRPWIEEGGGDTRTPNTPLAEAPHGMLVTVRRSSSADSEVIPQMLSLLKTRNGRGSRPARFF